MKDLKSRLELLEMDLANLEKMMKKGESYGTPEDWRHVLQKVRKVEEFAITQLALHKYMKKE